MSREAASAGEVGEVSELVRRGENGDACARAAACEALGSLGDKRTVLPLLTWLDDPDPEVQKAAGTALGSIPATTA